MDGDAMNGSSERVEIGFGDLGWHSLFHRGCPETHFGGIVGPDGPGLHELPDGALLPAWKCHHCGVRFFAGPDTRRRVTVVRRASE